MRRWILSTVGMVAVVASATGVIWADVRPSHAEGNEVGIDDSDRDPQQWKFVPAEITVPPGTTVTWKNDGKNPHTVKANDGSFDSSYISPGQSWQHTFSAAGDFPYYCEPHPWKKGVVHVK